MCDYERSQRVTEMMRPDKNIALCNITTSYVHYYESLCLVILFDLSRTLAMLKIGWSITYLFCCIVEWFIMQ